MVGQYIDMALKRYVASKRDYFDFEVQRRSDGVQLNIDHSFKVLFLFILTIIFSLVESAYRSSRRTENL